nr:hypothetical protein [Stenotrophomonas geniculata]
MLLIDFVRAAYSACHQSIGVYEWDESVVLRKRLGNLPDFNSLTIQRPDLQFSAWSLAHAVVKADYLDNRSLLGPGIGFLLQSHRIIDWSTKPVRLVDGASKALNDVTYSSLAARVGQGFAMLYGHQLGMEFLAHLSSHVSESHPERSGERMADFIFADKNKTIIIESKASFSLQSNDPSSIKRVLKDALTNQVEPWMVEVSPPASNGYVVYTCMRETSWAPSSISVVDPEGDGSLRGDMDLGVEHVMRRNYASWLTAMGLSGAASRLMWGYGGGVRDGSHESLSVPFIRFSLGDRSYGLPFVSIRMSDGYGFGRLVMALDTRVLQSLETVIKDPRATMKELLADAELGVGDVGRSVSVFPDGSLFGVVVMPQLEVINFQL